MAPLQPLPPRAPTPTPPQPTPESRSRASSDPPTMDPVNVLQRQDHPGSAEAVNQCQVYDCLQPKDDRIYELTPIKYLHQTVCSSSAFPLVPPKSHSSRHSQDEGSKREEGERRNSSSEKTHSSQHSHQSRSSKERVREKERERKRERERGKERDSERGKERERERERERRKDKEGRHHSNSPERDSHPSKHLSSLQTSFPFKCTYRRIRNLNRSEENNLLYKNECTQEILSTPNVVSISYTHEVKNGERTGRKVLQVGVIKKLKKNEIHYPDIPIPKAIKLGNDLVVPVQVVVEGNLSCMDNTREVLN